jgi:flagellar motility protein MotE (MotC chaperone)
MMEPRHLKNLIAAKVVLVTAIIAIYQGWITLGDAPILAEGEKKAVNNVTAEQNDTASKDKEGQDEKNKEESSTNESKESKESKQTEKTDEKGDKAASKTRKSFLSDLFELPKLDPKTARKEEIGKYLDMADRRDRQLKDREELLKKRENQLIQIEKSLDEKLVKLDEERKFFSKTIQQEKDLKGERLEKLITLYDKMEPKKAATQIEKLDKDLVVGLFKGLKQKQVTTILEFMSPDKSAEITEYFGRVKSAREYDLLKELNSSLKKEFADCKGLPEQQAEHIEKNQTLQTPSKTSLTSAAEQAGAKTAENTAGKPADNAPTQQTKPEEQTKPAETEAKK